MTARWRRLRWPLRHGLSLKLLLYDVTRVMTSHASGTHKKYPVSSSYQSSCVIQREQFESRIDSARDQSNGGHFIFGPHGQTILWRWWRLHVGDCIKMTRWSWVDLSLIDSRIELDVVVNGMPEITSSVERLYRMATRRRHYRWPMSALLHCFFFAAAPDKQYIITRWSVPLPRIVSVAANVRQSARVIKPNFMIKIAMTECAI